MIMKTQGRQLGHLTSEQTRKKISDAIKTKWNSKEYRGKMVANHKGMLGKTHTEEWRQKMKGENHWNYKHGLSKINKYRRFYTTRYYTKQKGNGGTHSFVEWESLKMKYRYMCLCCKQCEPEIKLTEDHIIPISLGGSDNIDNIQPLCKSCNSRKMTKTTDFRINFIKFYG